MIARVPGLRQVPQAVGPILEDVVLFDSWRGQYSDNPRAISEELHARGAGLRHVWVLHPAAAVAAPEWVVPVVPGSARHLAMLGRARYLVANTTVPGYHRKRPGTTFLQTWHGTPLKRIGFDIPRRRSRAARQAVRTLRRNVLHWDRLLAPCRFSTPIFRDAFRYSGPILEAGYPRNDMLVAPEAAQVRGRARAQLGIRAEQRAVLYAPTFRDDRPFPWEEELHRVAEELGESFVVLLRAHKLDAGRLAPGRRARFQDVSGHQDGRELLLAADVLVTDYSSVMFDFAVTRKPMVFFTPDLEHYRDELRGFYVDLEEEAPGPLVATADDLVRALGDLDAVAADHRPAYDRFVARFCDLDDGRASERVVDALLAS